MFTPNLVGSIMRRNGRDLHGRPTLTIPASCPFSIINLKTTVKKTSVRADSSASRGSADDTSIDRGRILVPGYVVVSNGDIFSFAGVKYEIVAINPRYSVTGILDHVECDLEVFAG